jgi:hypothetical protein
MLVYRINKIEVWHITFFSLDMHSLKQGFPTFLRSVRLGKVRLGRGPFIRQTYTRYCKEAFCISFGEQVPEVGRLWFKLINQFKYGLKRLTSLNMD